MSSKCERRIRMCLLRTLIQPEGACGKTIQLTARNLNPGTAGVGGSMTGDCDGIQMTTVEASGRMALSLHLFGNAECSPFGIQS